mmetsp:Transcript_43247/g.123280  ORF Transcript_43247/g.123280 Transcript_43247/m.123280 type:complete len:620 (-) Transcript_43247:94-1953(-)
MIDAFYIFTKGGLLLWSTQLVKVRGGPVDRLIREVLLEERVGETSACLDSYNLKWKLLNEMDLFFVVVYQGILQLSYLEGMLERVAKEFLNHVGSAFGSGLNIKHVDFDADFLRIRQKTDKELQESKKASKMRSFADTKKGKDVKKNQEEKGITTTSKKKVKGGKEEKENLSGNDDEDEDEDEAEAEDKPGAGSEVRQRLAAKTKPGPPKKKEKEQDPAAEKPKKKEARQWEYGKVNSSTMKNLDFSKNKSPDDEDDFNAAKQKEFLGSGDEGDKFMAEDDVQSLSSSSDGEEQAARAEPGKPGRVGGLFKTLTRGVKNLTGGAVLTEEELEPILQQFKTALMSKNVAADVSSKLAESVRHSLVGKTTERFTSMSSAVKTVLQDSMETLLTPKKSIDVLRAALAAKNAGRVYSIVFLGVNGVGKSTNLAKVAYYLKHKGGLNVLICACDTFRAGAVEQLKTHSRCLDVPLFERGYGKDPAEIAKSAIAHARNTDVDVVLVDTAGRMQDNEPLMRALAKLVAVNNPDLVLFVGEALVGNDAIDQVSKFNRSLVDMSHDPRNPRGIDGMLLTKYDTVDDKVGAALSMVYVTGQPIVFVGTGQKYTHLRKMQAKEVVRTLLG